MIGLDTNVLIRYAAQDDPVQSTTADRVIESLTIESPGFVSNAALVESIWVLRHVFKADADSVARFVGHLLSASELVVEHAQAVRNALDLTAGSLRFNDALIAQVGKDAGCDHTVTFDRKASQLPGMKLLGG